MNKLKKAIRLLAEANEVMGEVDYTDAEIRKIRMSMVFPALIRACNILDEREKTNTVAPIVMNNLQEVEQLGTILRGDKNEK